MVWFGQENEKRQPKTSTARGIKITLPTYLYPIMPIASNKSTSHIIFTSQSMPSPSNEIGWHHLEVAGSGFADRPSVANLLLLE
jgi:hypothetical protein